MVDKITGYQNLGDPNKIKWGRTVSETATKAITENDRLRQDFDNNSSSTRTGMRVLSDQVLTLQQQQVALASQQALITAQQDYLNSLVTYATTGSAVGVADTSGTLITSGTTTPSITFTLPQELKCKISIRGQALIAVSGSSVTTTNSGSITSAVVMDGSAYGGGQGRAFLSAQPGSGANSNFSTTSDIVAQVIVDITAGTHTASSRFQFQGYGASCSMNVLSPTMTVEVIGLP